MIKIKYILLCLLCLLALRTGAQSLVAYHVVGKVTYMVNGESKPLVMSTKVNGSTRVNIPYGGKGEFLDEKNKKRIIIKTPGQNDWNFWPILFLKLPKRDANGFCGFCASVSSESISRVTVAKSE